MHTSTRFSAPRRDDDIAGIALAAVLQFPVDRVREPQTELELVRPIPFHALCEWHLIPFHGAVHIGYLPGCLPGEKPVKQAEFARIVKACSTGIQTQQRMTTRIGLWLHHQLAPRGVGVLVEGGYACETACAPAHSSAHPAGPTSTLAFYGSLRHSVERQREFLTRTSQELNRIGVQ
ncbi:GTP cyclohydrolase I [Mycobacterium vicinigordonae]|uniref:GTP cyclohydrolase 1 n=1 Tax=Mycobacterium vicinigordonae TaxID=1719132 RepID=A0A7D6E162_9MYCO|nr:GTP cyclohydrolase I [Mycobacterium vicinigordonae]QLL07321.1 GTP cyclohydrolase I [Mycobacterium vicinigordonae]